MKYDLFLLGWLYVIIAICNAAPLVGISEPAPVTAVTGISYNNATAELSNPLLDNQASAKEAKAAETEDANIIKSTAPAYDRQYRGVFEKLCDQVTQRFYKLGQCISKTPQFQSLNSTFWYQAAKQELCGYPLQWSPHPHVHNSSAAVDRLERILYNSTSSSSSSSGDGVQNKAIHVNNKAVAFTASSNEKSSQLLSMPPLPDTATDDKSVELQAQYLYLLKKMKVAEKENRTVDPYTELDALNLNDHEKRSVIDMVTGPGLTVGTCLSLCDLLRQGSNTLDKCWEITSLTVLYGVCSVGCYYYL